MALEDLLIAGYIQRIDAIVGKQTWYRSGVLDYCSYAHVKCKSEEDALRVRKNLEDAGLTVWRTGQPNHLFAYIRVGYGHSGLLDFQWYHTPEWW